MSMEAMFNPRGIVVAGASTHPGKFGFVTLHNLLASGFSGEICATNSSRSTILGIETVAEVAELAGRQLDLVVVCTPQPAVEGVLRSAAHIGIRAAFITSAGYAESGEAGRILQAELVELGRELGMTVGGPNGQGVISTPARMCAQIVGPYPPPGPISIASQSGNFVSSWMNWAIAGGVGVARAVSAGNAAASEVIDYFEYFAQDPQSRVALGYIEGLPDGRDFFTRLGAMTASKPVVLVKGGTTAAGAAAAASHTGALAGDGAILSGVCRQMGVNEASTIEEGYYAAATLATQPLPKGARVAVLTTAGGWGVVTSDAIARSEFLELAKLSPELVSEIDALLPPRWSRGNPIDCAGGETRDTIPALINLIVEAEEVDALIYLGLGIQSNQAALFTGGPCADDPDVERISSYHRRQDERFARAAVAASERSNKPVLVATELAISDPANPGPAALRDCGQLCYPTGNHAVTALDHLVRYARYRQRVAAR